MKLSIIIPVYRVEKSLERCLESIVRQSFQDFEMILVDDGSPDRCPQICDEWAGRDPRIKVIHKANGGLSDARNAGIERAQGEYLTFVDSDDYLDTDTYERVMPLMEQNDIVEFPVYWHYGAADQHILEFGETTYQCMEDYWLRGMAYEHTYAWNKIYRRTLFEEVRFPKGQVFEDVATLPLLLEKARRVTTCRQGLYYYTYNAEGITAKATGRELTMLLESHLPYIRRYAANPDDAFDRYYMHVLNIQLDVCETTGCEPRIPNIFICSLGKHLNPLERLKSIALNILGINRLCKINKFIHQTIGRRS